MSNKELNQWLSWGYYKVFYLFWATSLAMLSIWHQLLAIFMARTSRLAKIDTTDVVNFL
ncbi:MULTISPECIES: hypothetical protein [unclassified Moraxella]|uniref:hypothetical protein n=1 Tax=unclassified Moraxella TaxID=2685852 RepID=UPI00359D2A80